MVEMTPEEFRMRKSSNFPPLNVAQSNARAALRNLELAAYEKGFDDAVVRAVNVALEAGKGGDRHLVQEIIDAIGALARRGDQ
jgi:hypothetical protein